MDTKPLSGRDISADKRKGVKSETRYEAGHCHLPAGASAGLHLAPGNAVGS